VSIYTVFPNAPITEALLDIRVQFPREIDLKKLEVFHQNIKDRFPDKKQRISFEAGLQLSPEKPPVPLPASGGPYGYMFSSPNEKKVVQARLDGFTFNKLKPYENWERFFSEAKELWALYLKIANPEKVTRIALRYINRIEIPLPIKDFKEYILTIPDIAPNLPQGIARLFMQISIPNHEIQATAIVTEAMESTVDIQKLSFIFDIDVFQEILSSADESEIWERFKKLRVFKNDIFFQSITEKTKELFK
jgi:uncharacterized protein (TIGR04255 family)